MGHIGLCITSNNSSDNMEMQRTTRAGFVPVFLYTRMPKTENFQVAYRDGLTAEALCNMAARECQIPRLSSNLFAIYDENNNAWLSPPTKIEPSDKGLTFRLRFHMSRSPTNITSLDENVVTYMFAQYRHDFLHDRIPRISMEESLGLMVLDMVQYAREKQVSIRHCLRRRHFEKFLPNSLSKDLTILDKWKLKKKIGKSLGEFERCDQDVNNYRMMFLISLMEENESWGVEEFETVRGQQYAVSIAAKGVKQISPTDQAKHFKLFFEDILNISLMASREAGSSDWIVMVSQRRDAPKEFLMADRKKAESLAALIDGYCRMQVDYYHYLIQETAPPSLVQLVKSRCHGPIPLSCAKRKIEEAGPEDGTYLIRQNPEDLFSYCLTVRMDGRIKNYKIIVDDDGSVGLPGQRSFPDIRTFAEYYRSSVNSACLEGPLGKALPYQPKEESLRMHDLSALPDVPQQQPPEPAIEWINTDNMSKKKRWRKLGGGAYTTVYRGEIKMRGKGWTHVAIKCPNRGAPQNVQQKFSQSVDVMSSWSNQSIIKFLGIGAGFSLIMEFAPFGSMNTFLQENQSLICKSHQVAMATQLINALEYLESRKIVHGKISAHNVVVVRSFPTIRVKLGDPMLSRYYHSQQMASKMERVRWTAPELLHSNAEPTLESDRWSFGMALWQIMAMGKIPFEDKTNEEVFQLYSSGRYPPFPANAGDAMNSLMLNCWHLVPSERFMCKQLLRELNRIYMGFQEKESANAIYWEVQDDEDEVEPILEDLSEGEGEDGIEDSDEETPRNLDWPVSPSPSANGPMFSMEFGMMPSLGGGAMADDSLVTPLRLMKFSGIEKIAEGTLEIGRCIGRGHFGSVYKGTWWRSALHPLPVAIKEITDRSNEKEMKNFEDEIRQLSMCDHKNIVKVLGVMEGGPENPLRLVMEFVPLGALNKFLEDKVAKKQPVRLSIMLTFAQQVAQGMAYLVDRHMVHRDLAARNVLVASDATPVSEPEVKISDFGLARTYTKSDYYVTSGQREVPMWMYAIECIGERVKFSSQSDVWSFGILLWEIFSYGEKPMYRNAAGISMTIEEIMAHLHRGHRLPQPAGAPQIMYTMMNECWHLDKNARPTFRKLVERLGEILEKEPNVDREIPIPSR